MKELDALMNALDGQRIPESLRKTAEEVPFPKHADTPEKKQELLNKAVRMCLVSIFAHNDGLDDLFANFCYELGMKTLIEKLDIKAPEKSPEKEEPESDSERLIAGLNKLFEILLPKN